MIETEVNGGYVIKLPGKLDLAATHDLLAAIKGRSEGAKHVWLDASSVETLEYPCIQVLLAAGKSPGIVSVENPSMVFISAFTDHGLTWDHVPAERRTDGVKNDVQEVAEKVPDASPVCVSLMTKRILTIDDSKTMRDMLKLTLAHHGFDVIQAVDGEDGINVLSTEDVDVVITDINMPKMDGYQVIEHLRKDRKYDDTPILVLTTESDRDKKERARGLGATGFIVKPFNPVSLIDAIHKVSP
jgi:two-component system chemotaxis response regulator CheY